MNAGTNTHDASLLDREGRVLYRFSALILLALSVLPAGALLWASLFPAGQFEPGHLLNEVSRASVTRAAWNSVSTSALAAVLSLLLGGCAAILVAATDMRGKRAFAFLFAMSMLIAPQVAALAFKSLLGPASPVLQAIGLAPAPGSANPMLGRWGIVFVLGIHHAPMVMLTLLAGFKCLPNHIIEAAAIDGARARRITLDIVLPLLTGHLGAGALIAFVAAFGNFGIPSLLGLPVNFLTLPTLIYRQLSSFGPTVISDVAAISVLVAALAGAVILSAAKLLGMTGPPLDRESALRPYWRLGRTRGLIEAAAAGLIVVALVLPVISLLSASLVPAYGMRLDLSTLTFRAFGEVLFRQAATVEAFRTSFALSGFAALLLAIIAVPMAIALHRHAGRSRPLMIVLIEMPYALPGIVIAIATILLFIRPLPLLGFSLYATPWIILFAYLCRFLALAVKPVAATFAQVPPAIEEAGALCGARFWMRLFTLILPQLLPAMTAGALLVFLTAFNELTVSALLWTAGTRTLGVVLYGFEEAGLTTEASALGIVTILVVGLLMLAIDRMRPLLPAGVIPWAIDEK